MNFSWLALPAHNSSIMEIPSYLLIKVYNLRIKIPFFTISDSITRHEKLIDARI